MNRTNRKLNKSIYRVLLILLGSSIYWIGYYGFFTRQEGDLLAAGMPILYCSRVFYCRMEFLFIVSWQIVLSQIVYSCPYKKLTIVSFFSNNFVTCYWFNEPWFSNSNDCLLFGQQPLVVALFIFYNLSYGF